MPLPGRATLPTRVALGWVSSIPSEASEASASGYFELENIYYGLRRGRHPHRAPPRHLRSLRRHAASPTAHSARSTITDLEPRLRTYEPRLRTYDFPGFDYFELEN